MKIQNQSKIYTIFQQAISHNRFLKRWYTKSGEKNSITTAYNKNNSNMAVQLHLWHSFICTGIIEKWNKKNFFLLIQIENGKYRMKRTHLTWRGWEWKLHSTINRIERCLEMMQNDWKNSNRNADWLMQMEWKQDNRFISFKCYFPFGRERDRAREGESEKEEHENHCAHFMNWLDHKHDLVKASSYHTANIYCCPCSRSHALE